MDSEDGKTFVKNLSHFVRTHERALAEALSLHRQGPKNARGQPTTSTPTTPTVISTSDAAVSKSYLSFTSAPSPRTAKLTLTPHHLYFLLSRFEDELGIDPGPMSVRLEDLHNDNPVSSGYMSFYGIPPSSRRARQSDAASLRSVSSMRSVMTSMSSVWSTLTGSNSAAKEAKQKAQYLDDLKYLYSCFTKLPALRLAPDYKARPISGFEEFPFDTAVPLYVFKNLSSLEICDLDFRTFYGWDRLAEQLRSLTIKNAMLEDPIELLQNIVLDDAEKRRKLSSRTQVPSTPSTPGPNSSWFSSSPKKYPELGSHSSQYGRRPSLAPTQALERAVTSDGKKMFADARTSSNSPPRPATSRNTSLPKPSHGRPATSSVRRSSGSSGSSRHEMSPRHSASDLLSMGILPSSKWRFLRHLSLSENGLTHLTVSSLAAVASTLQSLDLSGNLFSEVPEALASLTHLRALNLSNCMIESLSSLARNPLPAITTLNLRSNRLLSLAGIERLYSLERVDLRDNRLHDPTELARLTGIPDIADLYVIKNPFTKTHSNYRITIFNLFRASPGHVSDVTIDSTAPSNAEKKNLVDRVPEPANKPVVKAPPEEEEPARIVYLPLNTGVAPLPATPPTRGHRRATSDMGPGSTIRRKKNPRRRVVELAQPQQTTTTTTCLSETDDAPPPVPELTEFPPVPHMPNTEANTESDQPTTPEAIPRLTAPLSQEAPKPLVVRPKLDTGFIAATPLPKIRDSSDDDNSPVRSPEGLDPNTDIYRQKIEAMKSELGPNWLTALNDDRLVDAHARNRSFSPAARTPPTRPDHPSRGVSVGGRTLG